MISLLFRATFHLSSLEANTKDIKCDYGGLFASGMPCRHAYDVKNFWQLSHNEVSAQLKKSMPIFLYVSRSVGTLKKLISK